MKLTRFLTILAAVCLCICLLSVTAAAEITGEGSAYTFTTFADLQELLSDPSLSSATVTYNGADPLVISQDLTVPTGIDLVFPTDKSVEIAQGVTFTYNWKDWTVGELTVNGTLNALHINFAGDLTVNGTVNTDSFDIYKSNQAVINGTVNIASSGFVSLDATVTGSGSIVAGENVYSIGFEAANMAQLKHILSIPLVTQNESSFFHINLMGDFVVDEDITIPENCWLNAAAWDTSLTINPGCTMTVNCTFEIWCPVTVAGNYVHTAETSLKDHPSSDITASMTFLEGSSYSCSGSRLYLCDVEDPGERLSGLDMNQFEIRDVGDHLILFYKSQMSPATDLQWDPATGSISFQADLEGGYAWISLWKEGMEDPIDEGGIYGHLEQPDEQGRYRFLFLNGDLETGNYYCTVTVRGFDSYSLASDPAASPVWAYTRPQEKVDRCTNLGWEGSAVAFDLPVSAGGCEVLMYYAAEENGDLYYLGSRSFEGSELPVLTVESFDLQQYGYGYYYYRVRALSSDITELCHSNYVKVSQPYFYGPEIELEAPAAKVSGVSSSGKNKVSWNKVDNAVKYQVYRATSKSGTYKLMKTTTSTSYTHTSGTAGKTYYYKVRAVAEDGTKSEYSSIVSRTCDLARPTVKVTNVSSSGKIKVSWNKVEGAKEYKIYRATSKTGTYKLMKTTTSTSYTNTSATAGKTYYYKVKAVHENSSANSAYSEIVSRRCDLPRPVVSIKLSKGDPKLSWSKISGAKEYKIYRATSKSGTYKLIKTTSSTSYTDTSAKAGRTYYYKVVAVHKTSSANSAYSLIDSIKAK